MNYLVTLDSYVEFLCPLFLSLSRIEFWATKLRAEILFRRDIVFVKPVISGNRGDRDGIRRIIVKDRISFYWEWLWNRYCSNFMDFYEGIVLPENLEWRFFPNRIVLFHDCVQLSHKLEVWRILFNVINFIYIFIPFLVSWI